MKYLDIINKEFDIINKEFDELTVKECVYGKGKYAAYLCECKCGNTIRVTRYNLIKHKVKSCGCLRKMKWRQRHS